MHWAVLIAPFGSSRLAQRVKTQFILSYAPIYCAPGISTLAINDALPCIHLWPASHTRGTIKWVHKIGETESSLVLPGG